MTVTERERLIGAPVDRIEGRDKVEGKAAYAVEWSVPNPAYAHLATATITRGTIRAVDATAARAVPGVLAVITHEDAPELADGSGELGILQSPRVAYRGQVVGIVVAESSEAAREGAELLRFDYAVEPHDVVLTSDHPTLYRPDTVSPGFETDTVVGDVEAALHAAEVKVDATYSTPAEHNNPMEPHATTAIWEEDALTVIDAIQGAFFARNEIARRFGLDPSRVRVLAHHVGGGFGSKGPPRPQAVAAIMASRHVGRPVRLALTRRQMFALTGYRTPTIQRVQLGARKDGRMTVIAHDVWEQTSTVEEFAEQTSVVTRMMYAAPIRRTTHRLARLDVPTPSWMRAPGECPGMFALESALDELAITCGLDPIELRVRNEPRVDPESGLRFSTRNLVACFREGAERFGWDERDPTPGIRRDGRWLLGTGVASSTYPARKWPSVAYARRLDDGTFLIRIGAIDIGTGARTILAQIAADTLDVPLDRIHIEIGDSDFGRAMLAGGSMGTSSWGSAVVMACRRPLLGQDEALADTEGEQEESASKHAFGAQFVEVAVNMDTGEVRIPRALGVFACGRIMNAKTARSQFIGGMTMGIGMALLEESVMDPHLGGFVNPDLAQYRVPVNADIRDVEAIWVDEVDTAVSPMGAKGIGEIGIVGTAAAVANAVHHATGVRVRDLPIRPDRLLGKLPR